MERSEAVAVKGAPDRRIITPPRGIFTIGLDEIWRYRELLYFFVWRDVKVRYKQTILGALWAVLQPLLGMVVFTLLFGRLAGMPSDGIAHPVFYFIGLLPWTYFSNVLMEATGSLVGNQAMIRKVYFPRVLLPLSSALSPLVDFGLAFAVLVVVMVVYRTIPTAAALLLPLFLVLAMVTALALGIALSALNAMYRDVRYVVPFLVHLWLFASPVVYPSSLIPERWRFLYGLNPMAGVIEGFRWSLTGTGEAPGALMVASGGAVLLLLVGSLAYFRRVEGTLADRV